MYHRRKHSMFPDDDMVFPECMLSYFSHIQLFVTPWIVAHQAPLSMKLSRQEYWSGLPCPPPGGLPDPGIKPGSFTSPMLAGVFFATSATWEVYFALHKNLFLLILCCLNLITHIRHTDTYTHIHLETETI